MAARAFLGACLVVFSLASAANEAVLTQPEPAGPALFPFLMKRAEAWQRAGQPAKQIADLKRAAESAETARERVAALRAVVHAEMDSGSMLTALEYNALAYQAALDTGPPARLQPLSQKVNIHTRLGETSQAQAALDEMDFIMRRLRRGRMWAERGDAWTTMHERTRARLLASKGQHQEAEQASATALAAAERWLMARVEAASEEEREDIATQTQGIEAVSRELAQQQLILGKLAHAELTVRRALQLSRARMGERSATAMRGRFNLARVLVERGRYAEAEREAREALKIAEKLNFGGASFLVWAARDVLGQALTMQARWDEAVQVYGERETALVQADPELRKRARFGSISWAMALVQTGRLDQASTMLSSMVRRLSDHEGEGSFNVAMARGMLAVALHRRGDSERAIQEFRRAVPALLERAYQDQKDNRDGPARIARLVFVLEGYMRALEAEPGAGAEMFRIADFARGGHVQRALALGAARAAVRSPALAALIEKREALENRIVTLSGTLSDLLNAPEDKRLGGVIDQMRRDLDHGRAQAAELGARIEREHPDFAALIAPRAVTLDEARAALRPGEALLSIYLAEDRAYVWAFGAAGSAMSVRHIGAAQFAEWVGALRKALDVGAVPLERFPAFDTATAHRLYRELLEPVRQGWAGVRTLVVIPHRALGQLPFSVLATEAAAPAQAELPFAGYRSVPWLVKDIALVQLPAAASLVTLAKLPAPSSGRRPFIGFGDPVFAARQASPGATRGSLALRNLAILRGGEAQPAEARVAASFAKLPALPDTREEIREIAALLRADPDKEVFIGLEANEQRVKALDLSRHRVIAFATHGLVPGDLEGLAQPALALSNPELAGVAGDGVLQMDEILGLKLDADWVVLSACNTAAGGAGEEAVSGLGRSFFYAGARALLVSNWPVETVSARLLTTEIFRRQAADGKLSRAQALRQAMLHVMQNETGKDRQGRPLFSYAHPIFWAPFSLVGDGN